MAAAGRLLAVGGLLALQAASCGSPPRSDRIGSDGSAWAERLATDSAFGAAVERLSGPGAYFDTDNLISNESSYLHPLPALAERGVRGGAYLGVGPGQNFSYIAAVRPRIAFIVDIRRDNLLQHLMFKALFAASGSRIEYLARLFGRPEPPDPGEWADRGIDELLAWVDANPPAGGSDAAAVEDVLRRAASFGIPLSAEDRGTIRRFHETFVREGPDLRFRSHGRAPRPYYPTYRELLLERDVEGRRAAYLAEEGDWRFVKSLSDDNLIVPVVGDLGGEHALAAVGRLLSARGETVSAFYTSNVEFYLMRQGTFGRFVDNLSRLPHGPESVLIRSYFGGAYGLPHPQQVPGYPTAQLLQPIPDLLARAEAAAVRSYWELVTEGALPLRREAPAGVP